MGIFFAIPIVAILLVLHILGSPRYVALFLLLIGTPVGCLCMYIAATRKEEYENFSLSWGIFFYYSLGWAVLIAALAYGAGLLIFALAMRRRAEENSKTTNVNSG